MFDPTSNDNHVARAEGPNRADAHGQAAMLLVESLIHGLIARSVIRLSDAIEIVGAAVEVAEDEAGEPSDSPSAYQEPVTILGAIRASLSIDLPREGVRPWPPRP